MTILDSAEWLRQKKNYSGSGAWLDEANSHDAQFGSTSGADANDPLFKDHDGTQYIFMPGTVNNAMLSPDIAAYDFASDVDLTIQLWVAVPDTTPAARSTLIGNNPGNYSVGWSLYIESSGTLIYRYHDGVNHTIIFGGPGMTPDTIHHLAITHDFSGNEVKAFLDGSQIGTTKTPGVTTGYTASTQLLRVAASGVGSTIAAGDFYAAIVGTGAASDAAIAAVTGIGEVAAGVTAVYENVLTDATEPFAAFTERSSNAATVTIEHGSSGLVSTVIDRNWSLLTTDDYFETPDDVNLDFAGGDAGTWMVMFRTNTVASGDDVLMSKKDDLTTSAGYALVRSTANGKGIIADGTADDDDTVATVAIHTLHTLAMVRNTTDDDIEVFLDGVPSGSATTDSTTVTLANALVQRLGATSGATPANFFEGVIGADAGWRFALTNAEVQEAHDRLTTLGSMPPVRRDKALAGIIQR